MGYLCVLYTAVRNPVLRIYYPHRRSERLHCFLHYYRVVCVHCRSALYRTAVHPPLKQLSLLLYPCLLFRQMLANTNRKFVDVHPLLLNFRCVCLIDIDGVELAADIFVTVAVG